MLCVHKDGVERLHWWGWMSFGANFDSIAPRKLPTLYPFFCSFRESENDYSFLDILCFSISSQIIVIG